MSTTAYGRTLYLLQQWMTANQEAHPTSLVLKHVHVCMMYIHIIHHPIAMWSMMIYYCYFKRYARHCLIQAVTSARTARPSACEPNCSVRVTDMGRNFNKRVEN